MTERRTAFDSTQKPSFTPVIEGFFIAVLEIIVPAPTNWRGIDQTQIDDRMSYLIADAGGMSAFKRVSG